jgi:predicted PurR-regulated permease PerM
MLALGASAGIGWLLVRQVTTLASDLPRYRTNIRQRLADIRAARRDRLGTVEDTARNVMKELEKTSEPPLLDSARSLVVVKQSGSLLELPSVLELLSAGGLVVILVVFMLIRRADLRTRLVRIFGHGRLAVTSRALDEAGLRISRYLLMQSILNGGFGAAVGAGLALIGVPYSFLWGFFASILRFLPYVGVWIAAAIPVVIGLAVFDGWTRSALVIGLFVIVELLTAFVLEPLLYGRSAGVSETAILVATAFWTWLWGPVGLLLATPLTVCLVVLARHIPDLDFILVLAGEEAGLEPDIAYYERLLAMDREAAALEVTARLETEPLSVVCDEVVIPALSGARRDHARGRLTDQEAAFVLDATRETVRQHMPPEGDPGPRPGRGTPKGPMSWPSACCTGCSVQPHATWP